MYPLMERNILQKQWDQVSGIGLSLLDLTVGPRMTTPVSTEHRLSQEVAE